MSVLALVAAITDIGVLPSITIGAVLFLASTLYKRFRH